VLHGIPGAHTPHFDDADRVMEHAQPTHLPGANQPATTIYRMSTTELPNPPLEPGETKGTG
jgi:hypothetical protein